MYLSQRKMILETFHSMILALEEARKQPQHAQQLAFDCMQGIIQADSFLTKTCPAYQSDALQKVVDCLEQIETQPTNALHQASIAMHNCDSYIRTLPVRYKMVFMPYIASMWTALESVWAAANADPDCDAYVVPIPYWNLKTLPDGTSEKTTLVYEGGKFPDYVPVIDYQRFDLEAEHPDAIYIHNPYDDNNSLTRILEKYYSENLKKHTEKLIYSPTIFNTLLPQISEFLFFHAIRIWITCYCNPKNWEMRISNQALTQIRFFFWDHQRQTTLFPPFSPQKSQRNGCKKHKAKK